ncbi:hypothetical protein M422DRAFT_238615 [Sphaerobolus stellatus SS14]|nr:hypothetical protein M422DRAFT_238615 [Sphaerobolus stellatus SS14]
MSANLWYPNDSVLLKLTVLVLFGLEMADTGVSTYIAYAYMVSGWGHIEALFMAPSGFATAVILTGIIAVVAQLFFARRLWVLSRSVITTSIVVLLSLVQCATAIAGSAQVISVRLNESAKLSTFGLFSIWLACSVACDVLIAVFMIYFLCKRKSGVVLRSSDFLITRLINYSFQTGAFTAICALLSLILFLRLPTTDLMDAPFFVLGRLYSNAVLANLNARAVLFSGLQIQPETGGSNSDPEQAFTTNPDFAWTPDAHPMLNVVPRSSKNTACSDGVTREQDQECQTQCDSRIPSAV